MIVTLCVAAVVAATGLWMERKLNRDFRDLPPLERPEPGDYTVVHRDGLPWLHPDVPKPPLIHGCQPQTGAWVRTPEGVDVWIERCPCGGLRENNGRWQHRNDGRPPCIPTEDELLDGELDRIARSVLPPDPYAD